MEKSPNKSHVRDRDQVPFTPNPDLPSPELSLVKKADAAGGGAIPPLFPPRLV